jgi:hypothetical protein
MLRRMRVVAEDVSGSHVRSWLLAIWEARFSPVWEAHASQVFDLQRTRVSERYAICLSFYW